MLGFILQGVMKENKRLKDEKEQREKKAQEDQKARMQAIEDGVCCLLRKELIADHEKWMDRGYITPKALDNGLSMYDAYKGLGGNGMIDHMKEEIEELPIKEG
jgi:hypothetical protein